MLCKSSHRRAFTLQIFASTRKENFGSSRPGWKSGIGSESTEPRRSAATNLVSASFPLLHLSPLLPARAQISRAGHGDDRWQHRASQVGVGSAPLERHKPPPYAKSMCGALAFGIASETPRPKRAEGQYRFTQELRRRCTHGGRKRSTLRTTTTCFPLCARTARSRLLPIWC